MARVTIEDCLEHMDDRFRIVLAAARRKANTNGFRVSIESENDKSTVVALREIAAGFVDDAESGAEVEEL